MSSNYIFRPDKNEKEWVVNIWFWPHLELGRIIRLDDDTYKYIEDRKLKDETVTVIMANFMTFMDSKKEQELNKYRILDADSPNSGQSIYSLMYYFRSQQP